MMRTPNDYGHAVANVSDFGFYEKKLTKKVYLSCVCVFVLGFALLISGGRNFIWLTDVLYGVGGSIPSVHKISMASAHRELMQQYLAVVFLISPFFSCWFVIDDCVGARVLRALRNGGRSPLLNIFLMLFFVAPFLLFLLYTLWALPITLPSQPGMTRGLMFLYIMQNNSFLLVVTGAILSVAMSLIYWMLLLLILSIFKFISSRGDL